MNSKCYELLDYSYDEDQSNMGKSMDRQFQQYLHKEGRWRAYLRFSVLFAQKAFELLDETRCPSL